MRRLKRLLPLLLLASASISVAQTPSEARSVKAGIRAWRASHEAEVIAELMRLLEIPNLASDRAGIARNADTLIAMLARRGIAGRRLESEGSAPAVFGELRVPGATRTIVLYAHYDGQPVDTNQWRSPPWRPRMEGTGPEARIYARSASDDKSPIVAVLAALDALRASGQGPSVNVKFFFEGEEEAGSPHLREMLTRHRDLLAADLWIFADGPVHQSRRPQIVFGVRGTLGFQLTVYGPTRPLHSGHYGNWAPNPGVLLAHLITSMRDADGRVLIDGFYEGVRPVSEAERRAIAAVPPVEDGLRAELGLAATEAGNAPLLERLMLPALNVQGIEMARVGAGAANVIPTAATAAFGVRLVPDQTIAGIEQAVRAHLRRQGWHVVESEPDSATRATHPRIVRATFGAGGYPAQRTPLEAPAAQAIVRALEPALDQPLILVPTSGGSLPLVHFVRVLGAPLISLPTVNHDNNQHGANENLRLQNLWDAIETFGVLLARLGPEWRERL